MTGGLYIDFGVPGIVIGGMLLGIVLSLLHFYAMRYRSGAVLVLYVYFGAYMALSAYSYVSVKPEVLVVFLLSGMVFYLERHSRRVLYDDQNE